MPCLLISSSLQSLIFKVSSVSLKCVPYYHWQYYTSFTLVTLAHQSSTFTCRWLLPVVSSCWTSLFDELKHYASALLAAKEYRYAYYIECGNTAKLVHRHFHTLQPIFYCRNLGCYYYNPAVEYSMYSGSTHDAWCVGQQYCVLQRQRWLGCVYSLGYTCVGGFVTMQLRQNSWVGCFSVNISCDRWLNSVRNIRVCSMSQDVNNCCTDKQPHPGSDMHAFVCRGWLV